MSGRTLENAGTLNIETGNSSIVTNLASTLRNSELMDLKGDEGWSFQNTTSVLTLDNSGTLRKSAGTGTFLFGRAILTNTGTVEVLTGRLEIGGLIFLPQ